MILQKLDIYNVRNIKHACLTPSPSINFIFGNNAGGKSSLLEAIYILGRARSFRSTSMSQIINLNEDKLIVSGKIIRNDDIASQLGIRIDNKNVNIRIDNEPVKRRADLAYAFPLQLIHPKSYKLLDGGSQLRREFIDWGVFNLQNEFLPLWRNFKKSLSQRNILLKNKLISQIDVWNQELVQYGTIVADYREHYIKHLQPVFNSIVNQFFEIDKIEIRILNGWLSENDYYQVLCNELAKDLRYGYTHSGPHRGDFQLLVNNKIAKNFVSRGQLKLLVLSLKLAQVTLLYHQSKKNTCILIDDLASELDPINKRKLLNFLSEMNVQIFMTATALSDFGDITQLLDYKMFHVEHGKIKQHNVSRGTLCKDVTQLKATE